MVVAELDEVSYDLEVDGEPVRRMLHRRIWQRGAWGTVAVVYQDRGRDGAWKPARLALLRFQRVHDAWRKHAAIALAGHDALALTDTLDGWRDALATERDADHDSDPDNPADRPRPRRGTAMSDDGSDDGSE